VRVAFRVDAGPVIGAGHAIRCLTLADALARRGAQATFVAAAMPSSVEQRITAAGHKIVRIEPSPELNRSGPDWHQPALTIGAQEADVRATKDQVGSCDWLIVDHYLLDARWHSGARAFARRLLVIDDLADHSCDCDLLLDQTFGRSSEEYAQLVPTQTTILAGACYALLRREFVERRRSALDRRRKLSDVRRILVSLGAMDFGEMTAKVVEMVLATSPDCLINVVIGPDAPSLAGVKRLAQQAPNIEVHCGDANMADLMLAADLAIGAAGTTSAERCCLGVPSLVLVLAENQRCTALGLQDADAAMVVDDVGEIGSALPQLLTDQRRLQTMSAAAFALVDGLGTSRVVDAMLNPARDAGHLDIGFRDAREDDCELLWLWRNDPFTRRASRSRDAIPWCDHVRWYEAALSNPDVQLRIAEDDKFPVGMIRFDPSADDSGTYEVNINVGPGSRGRGVGRAVLGGACEELARCQGGARIIAFVASDNLRSQNLFESCGFRRSNDADERGLIRYSLNPPAQAEAAQWGRS